MKTMISSMILAAGLISAAPVSARAAPVTVIATVKVNVAGQDAFKAAAEEMVDITRTESGNITYQFVQSAADPTEFATIELWRSQADIDQHMKTAHMQNFFQVAGPLFAPGFPVVKTYEMRVK